MRSALFALAVTALGAGLVVAPATQQSAHASVLGGLKSGAPAAPVAGDLILVGKGGRGGGGFRGGGGGFKGGMRGGGGRAFRGGGGGFKGAYRGGGFKGYRGGGRSVYRGGGPRYAYSRGRQHARHWDGGRGKNWNRNWNKNWSKGRRYYRGRYYGNYWWYGSGIYVGAYGYGGCAWLRRQAIATGSPYWWNRYYDCVGYY